MAKKKTDDEDRDWFAALEAKVAEASSELVRLREANRDLEAQVEDLEGRLQKALDKAGDGEAAWRQEKAQMRQRVEDLIGTLEGLLPASDEADAPTEEDAGDDT